MKPLSSLALVTMLTAARVAPADPVALPPERQPNIVVEMQAVALPRESALPLIADMKVVGKVEAACDRIQKLLADGSAQLMGWPYLTCENGERSITEGIDEIRYPTEFSEPSVEFTPNLEGEQTIKVKPKVDMTVLAPSPTAFETRNTGVTLEVTPLMLKDQKTIRLELRAQDVRLKSYLRTTVEGKGAGSSVSVEQPEFETKVVTTRLTLHSGGLVLLGVFPMSTPANYIEVFLLRAEVK